MSDYVYTIAGKEVQLAKEATPRRISAFLSVFGKKKLSELITPVNQNISQASQGMNALLLDAIGDAAMTQKLLNACLDKEFTIEEANDVDSEVTGKIALDFFLLLIVKYFKQAK